MKNLMQNELNQVNGGYVIWTADANGPVFEVTDSSTCNINGVKMTSSAMFVNNEPHPEVLTSGFIHNNKLYKAVPINGGLRYHVLNV